jgi:3-oxoadipate CoA-transferase beta subunit
MTMGSYQRRTKDQLARRIAQDIPDGAYVNLGIGMPTQVANHIPAGREVILHSENGILGMGPAPVAGAEDYDLINAGKQPVTLLPGGAYFHHADSFAMMRGGHLDISVLGAFQVSATGDLANWSTGEPGAIPAVGGAMDLAVGAKKTWVMMDLLTEEGREQGRHPLHLSDHRHRLRPADLLGPGDPRVHAAGAQADRHGRRPRARRARTDAETAGPQ